MLWRFSEISPMLHHLHNSVNSHPAAVQMLIGFWNFVRDVCVYERELLNCNVDLCSSRLTGHNAKMAGTAVTSKVFLIDGALFTA